MTLNRRRIATLKSTLRSGAAALILGAAGAALLPIDAAWAQASPAPAVETSRHHVRLMMQTFDGAREYSHTQVAGVARQRRGDDSWTEINFGDGSVIEAVPGTTSVGGFTNTSGVETGLRYDHATHMLSGEPAVSGFHNRHVRPLLGRGPALGADASWTITVTPAQLGLAGLGAQPVTIEISRRYFGHDGRDYVLLHYRVPSFAYTAQGRPVVHWGEGVALADPGFGRMYWNATLHRAVASEPGSSGRPYRFSRTIAALDERGIPAIDPRRIPELAPYFDRFYGHSNDEVMGFVEGSGAADQGPIALSNALDIAALAVAADGTSQFGELSSAYMSGRRGSETAKPVPAPVRRAMSVTDPSARAMAPQAPGSSNLAPLEAPQTTPPGGQLRQDMEEDQRAISVGDAAGTWADIPVGSEAEAREFENMRTALQSWQQEGEALQQSWSAKYQQYQQTQRELQALPPMEMHIRPEHAARHAELSGEMMELSARAAQMQNEYEAVVRNGLSDWHRADALDDFEIANRAALAAIDRFQTFMRTPDLYAFAQPPTSNTIAARAQREAQELQRLGQQVSAHGQEGATLASRIQAIPPTRFRSFTNALGTALGPLGIAMDGYTIGTSLANLQNEMGRDAGTGGAPTLTRQYGVDNTLFWVDIGADLLGLAGSALTGDVPGTIASAAAIATSSFTDILISARGITAANRILQEAIDLELALARRQRQEYAARAAVARAAYYEEIRELDAEIAELDELPDVQDASRERLAELQARREEAARQAEEAARQAEAERQRLIAEARAENERIYQENLRRPPTAEEWAQFNRDIEEAMRPDYPTAPPPSPAEVAARLERAEERRRQEAAEVAAAAAAVAEAEAQAAAEAQAREEEVAEANAESVANREAEAQERRERNDEAEQRGLEVSDLDTEPVTFTPVTFTPVTFDPVTFDPVTFDPPVFVPPEFDPPDPSDIPWTNFDDEDWLGDADNLAFGYDNMSGVVETDLSRWAEWLSTQNVRELTRLALLAGYPNLASALADAENIIRLSQDQGYRRWALQAPSCGGYVGCGPSYLERWWMKQAIVSLGDILAASRDIFSTGGFSDIGITGFNLAYLLRDNALQDGDIVQITISQFGRNVYEGRLNLTNMGESFNLRLRPGVASLLIYAENEGSAPPNTAQIVVDNVVRGEGTQSYSLRTGQTATLRIETNSGGN